MSRDFSAFSLFTAGLACLVPLTAAYTQPKGAAPKGNPIFTPGLNDVVPVNQPYGVTWNPTTSGTVTLLLLKGPQKDLKPLYPLVEKMENSGTFIWTPSDKLEPSQDGTGYGIQLIVDETGQYQYSTPFGISNSGWTKEDQTSPSAYGSSTTTSSSSTMSAASGYAHPTGWASSNTTAAHPTGWKPHNTTMAHPTGGYHHTKKPTLYTTASVAASSTSAPAPPLPTHTQGSGASTVATSFLGLVLAGGVAVFAL